MSRRKTIEEFKQEVYNLVGNDYTLKSNTYVNAHTKLLMEHNKCGRVYSVSPHNFLAGKRCPYCSANHHRATQTFEQLIKIKTNNQWYLDPLTPYQGNTVKVRLIHRSCNHSYLITPKSFKQNEVHCSICESLEREKHKDQLKREQEKHLINGLSIAQIKQRKALASKRRKSTSQFKKEVYDLTDGEYKVIGKYTGSSNPIKIKHMTCGRVYSVRPDHFLRGNRCRCEHISRGESLVKSWLVRTNISFIYGYILPNKLHFDFYLPESNSAIEYDGIQHFKPRSYFGGDEAFRKQVHNDRKKDQYCREHNIKLIRIPYTVTTYREIKRVLEKYIN